MSSHSAPSLRHLLDAAQRSLSLNAQRGLLLLFLLLQGLLAGGYLVFERARIEADARRVVCNTALSQAQQFEVSLNASRYQLRIVGNAVLGDRVVAEHAQSFLEDEMKQGWPDAVIVFNAEGDFVASHSTIGLEQVLDATTIARKTFRDSAMFKDLRRDEVTEHLYFRRGDGNRAGASGFVLYRAVRDAKGHYLGGAVGYFDSSTLAKALQNMRDRGFDLGLGGVMAIVDRNNSRLLARLNASGFSAVVPSAPAPNLMDYAGDSALTAHSYVSPVDGLRRLGVFLNLNDRKWVLVVGLAESDFLTSWHLRTILGIQIFAVLAVLQWLLLHYARTNFLQRERLALEAGHDPLTNLPNRRYFDQWASGACRQALRHQQAMSVLILDLDFFKHINDCYGHDGGDAVLESVARTLTGLLREGDVAARFGGEEFVVALPQTQIDAAEQAAERIRISLATQAIEFKGQTIYLTASFGVAQMTRDELEGNGIHAALTRADHALYQSKQWGRNRVTLAD